MDRRSFLTRLLGSAVVVLNARGAAVASPPLAARAGDQRDPWEHYAHFENQRREKAHLLKPGERWLTPDDIVQTGDAYDGGGRDETGIVGAECIDCFGKKFPRWWAVGSKHTSVLCVGARVPLDVFCYTPKGKTIRYELER